MSQPDDRCTSCGAAFEPADRFCGRCGTPRAGVGPEPTPAAIARPAGVKPSQPSSPRGVLVAVIAVGLLGIVPMFFFGGGCESTEGQVSVSGGPHGDFTFVPTGCASLQPYGRFGANVHGDGPNDGAVYVSMDPTGGPAVQIEVPGSCRNANGTDCTVFDVPRASCEQFQVNVEHTNVTVNDVRLVQGTAFLRCALPDGTQVQGQLTFDGC